MLNANQVKPGVVIHIGNAPHIVQNVVKQTPSARGAKTLYKIKAKNLLNSQNTNLTCTEDDTFAEPNFAIRPSQYLYNDGANAVFLDIESFEQYEIPADSLDEQLAYLSENMEGIGVLILEEKAIGVRLPDVVEMVLAECDPAIKGATATARAKTAKTQTGLMVQVPEYMAAGEKIRVKTETGECLGRA
jgi:elongation factor P